MPDDSQDPAFRGRFGPEIDPRPGQRHRWQLRPFQAGDKLCLQMGEQGFLPVIPLGLLGRDHHDHGVVPGRYDNVLPTVSHCGEGAVTVGCPPEVTIVTIGCVRRNAFRLAGFEDPRLRDELTTGPAAPVQVQLPELRQVARHQPEIVAPDRNAAGVGLPVMDAHAHRAKQVVLGERPGVLAAGRGDDGRKQVRVGRVVRETRTRFSLQRAEKRGADPVVTADPGVVGLVAP